MVENGKIQYGKTLFTKRIPGGIRTYFFDVKQSEKTGKKYLLITESKQADDGWKRQSVMLFPDHAEDWKKTLDEALAYL